MHGPNWEIEKLVIHIKSSEKWETFQFLNNLHANL